MAYIYHLLVTNLTKGGYIMVVIFFVSLVAWYIGVEKWLFLRKFRRARSRYLRIVENSSLTATHVAHTGVEPFDVLLEQVSLCAARSKETCAAPLVFREFLIASVPMLERDFSTLAAWISVAPLLGLLGTVIGMIETFRVITTYGLGNPNLTAEGISIALLTTQAGLTVAFPLVLFHNYLLGQSRGLRSRLFKDGEALIARLSPQNAPQPGPVNV
jgi:biopolymer transport protein ExbB